MGSGASASSTKKLEDVDGAEFFNLADVDFKPKGGGDAGDGSKLGDRKEKQERLRPPAPGTYQTEQGQYKISRDESGRSKVTQGCKCCGKLMTGVLTQSGVWHEAKITEANKPDEVIGFFRCMVEDEGLRSQFRKTA